MAASVDLGTLSAEQSTALAFVADVYSQTDQAQIDAAVTAVLADYADRRVNDLIAAMRVSLEAIVNNTDLSDEDRATILTGLGTANPTKIANVIEALS